MVFRREGTYGLVALVLVFAAMMLFAAPAWAQTLDVDKIASPSSVAAEDVLTYQITVDNTGSATANDVKFTDALPNNTTFVSATFTNGSVIDQSCGQADGIVQCDLGDVTSTINATVTIQVRPTAAAAETTLQNTATAGGTRSNTVETSVTGNGPDDEDLTITKEADEDSVDVGDELDYEITVENDAPTGTQPVEDLEIRDILPDDVELIDVDEGENVDDCPRTNDDEVWCDLDPLGPGEKAVLFITIQPQEDADDEIENEARLFLNGNRIDEDRVSTDVNDDNNNGDNDNDGRNNNDEDDDNDGILDVEEDLADAEQDLLDDETTDGETTDGDIFDDNVDDDSPVSANADENGAEASTPGAVASAGGDPDELSPQTSVPDDVVNEIPTSGPLPNTGGMPMVYWLLPLAGLLILAGLPVYRWAKSRE